MKIPKNPWKKTIRRENGLIEHICKHGCGHPAAGHMHEVHFWEVEPASGDEAPGHAHTIPQASRWEDFDAD